MINAQELYDKESDEDRIIIDIIKQNYALEDPGNLLDIGGGDGTTSLSIQNLEKITIIDRLTNYETYPEKTINRTSVSTFEFYYENFSKNEKNKYQTILASHVWGCFENQKNALDSIRDLATPYNTAIFVYNTNTGFFGEFTKEFSGQNHLTIDYFDEKLLKNDNVWNETTFYTTLKENSFKDLAQKASFLFWDTSAVSKKDHDNKKYDVVNAEKFLSRQLYKPELIIEQKALFTNLKKNN